MKKPSTRVVNLRASAYDVYIGRPGKWGNPFVIGVIHQRRMLTRETCIAAYEDWLRHSDKGVALQADLEELRGKRLGCYCKPQACHGDVIVELLAELDE